MQIPNYMSLTEVTHNITNCKLCPRLIEYIQSVEINKPSRFRKDRYWNKPVPSFGDPKASLLVIGLAPAVNGGNRTGRMFTGDSSGQWLMKAMFETGFANLPTSASIDDGLVLKNAYVTSVVKCAPPKNKPTANEISTCSMYLKREIDLLKDSLKVVITLGKIAFDTYCNIADIHGFKFGHGGVHSSGLEKVLIVSYHPSRRNTNTGLLTWSMWIEIFKKAKSIVDNNPIYV
ncbi:MAG TPA: uracil-DNA glycosylase [Candidatus Nitrosocosmicus sp.]|nr:uracil-DNA glycosylase [Candidatus Nitrosocosmicus sp.]